MTKKVILLDAAKIDILVNQTGVAGLDAVLRRGDLVMFGDDALEELRKGSWFKKKQNRDLFNGWLDKQRRAGRLLEPKPLQEHEKARYDPNDKRLTTKGGDELWDMSARKVMAEHPDYEFEVISSDKDIFDNRIRGSGKKIVDTPFTFTSMKKLMGELAVDPDLNLSKEQFENIADYWRGDKYGDVKGLKQGTLSFPRDYDHALELKHQNKIRRETEALKKIGQNKNPLSEQERRARIGRNWRAILRSGTSTAMLGLLALPVVSTTQAVAAEKGISFDEAAQELGLAGFSEDQLIALAAAAGVDLAISFTPVGVLKRAWEILGNFDDLVTVAKVYGDAFPHIEVIQQMAALADEVSNSAVFKAYVDGRDALTGAVSDAIRWALGNSGSDEEAAQVIGQLRTALDETDGDMEAALARGASQAELEALLWQRAELSAPAPLVAPGFAAPDLDGALALPGDVPLSQKEVMAGSQAILPPGLSQGERLVPDAASEAGSDPGQKTWADGKGDRLARQTSYDRVRKLGRTPEEKAEALDEYEALVEENYLLTEDIRMAEEIAFEELQQSWQPSAFAADDGTVMKGPVETTYPDAEEDGHGYVRKEAEELLKGEGIRARKWFVEPNGQTAADRAQGVMDETGYGPRMTLLYEDETGRRHKLTEAFQADVGSARQRRHTAQEREDRKLAKAYGIAWPDTSGMTPFEAARARLQHAAELPELRERAKQAADDAKKTRQPVRAALPRRKPVAGADRQVQAKGAPVPPRRPEPESGADLTSGG